jgi:hypothetical protein
MTSITSTVCLYLAGFLSVFVSRYFFCFGGVSMHFVRFLFLNILFFRIGFLINNNYKISSIAKKFRCRIVNLPHSKPSPGMFIVNIPPRNICYIVNLPPRIIYYIVNIPQGENLLYSKHILLI